MKLLQYIKMAFLKTVSYIPTPWTFLSSKDVASILLSQSELCITAEVIS